MRRAEAPALTRAAKLDLTLVLLPALVIILYGALALARLGTFDLAQDEGAFGLSALNILTDYRQLALVSEHPGGDAGTKPYLYPLLLALSVYSFGSSEFALRIVNVAALAAASLFLYGSILALVRSRTLALLTAAFFVLNPGTIVYARVVTAEPSVLLWGSAALFAAAKFHERPGMRSAALCGIALGLAFLSKLWLILPFALACAVLLLTDFAATARLTALSGPALAFGLFLCVSASHLLLVLWWSPADIPHWLGIYFFISLKSRLSGQEYDPVLWFRPWWFYLAAVFKATFFALPWLFLGVRGLLRHHRRVLVAVVIAFLSPLLLMSLFRVKQALYIFPVFPALAFLLALGAERFSLQRNRRELISVTFISVAVAALFQRLHVITRTELFLVEALYLLALLPAFSRDPYGDVTRRLATLGFACAMLFGNYLVVERSLQHRTYYREIATYFYDQLRSKPLRQVSFLSPERSAIEFYTFRTGEYWETFYFHKSDSSFAEELASRSHVFYVIDPSQTLYGGKMSAAKLAALQSNATDITDHIERSIGSRLPLRVFVPTSERQRSRAPDERPING